MPGINIPGVSNKYNTNETVEKLMQIERIPLTREEKTLETYKAQQEAWRDVNRKFSTLRDSVKSLYSFDNPFNNKFATSTEEAAVTATASRGAAYDSFKIDIIQPASADRFLTSELDDKIKVPQGTYTYKVADKKVTLRWKGGSLQEFSNALNRRSNNILKSQVVGASKGKKTLVIESLKTGAENRLSFEGDAFTFALNSGMIKNADPEGVEFALSKAEFTEDAYSNADEQVGMPKISLQGVSSSDGNIIVPPRSGFTIKIPDEAQDDDNLHIRFSITKEETDDVTDALTKVSSKPVLPNAGSANFRDITIYNSPVDADFAKALPVHSEKLEKIQDENVIFALMADGSEQAIPTDGVLSDGKTEVDIPLSDYKGITALTIRNRNTGAALTLSKMTAVDPKKTVGFTPLHPISTADDAIIKYEGITIKRPTNEIDDVVPEVTLHVHEKTEKTATVSVKPDTESAKDALITFVGKYNQAVGSINILTQNKPELIDEMDYLSDDEKKAERERLGMFTGDSSLTSLKSAMLSTAAAQYPFSDNAEVTMLSQIGIATNASGFGGYSPGKLRGYLEIDEKKLDENLESHLDDIKSLFGYDSDGDLIIDSGIASKLDKQLTAYVRSGGIFSLKTAGLDGKIKSSEQRISRLETQMQRKEAELKSKYAQMEGALNGLETQQNAINNFSNRNNNNR
ncbi:MAG: flagellar filament capping protein FliD [Treponema sp.]